MCRAKAPASGSKEEIKRLRHWVEKGEVWAMVMLGDRYREGVGVTQSDKKAAKLYKLAADQGNAFAQSNLGVMYINGQGVGQSNQMAREWWVKAAEQGNETAIKYLNQLDKDEGITKATTTTTTTTSKPTRVCSTCNTPQPPNHKYQHCICRSVYYCSTDCQKKDWRSHKKEHKRICKAMKLKKKEKSGQ